MNQKEAWMLTVVALLHGPALGNFGRAPFVERLSEDRFRVRGLPGHGDRDLSAEDIEQLIDQGHALGVGQVCLKVKSRPEVLVAGWIGARFKEKIRALDLPLPFEENPAGEKGRQHHVVHLEDQTLGEFWLDLPEVIYDMSYAWIKQAALEVFKTPQHEAEQASSRAARIAEVMEQVLPEVEETEAALWYTRSPGEREEELDWFVRLRRDRGELCHRAEMKRRLERVIARLSRQHSTTLSSVLLDAAPHDDQAPVARSDRSPSPYPHRGVA